MLLLFFFCPLTNTKIFFREPGVLEKGNKAAGARARKAALNLMKLMKDFRKVSVEASK